ncbi:MAG: acyltransferase protein [Myxococcaceae bacterium]|nr:acyltransferase protein [Myxococcaceae bacterium]
MSLLSELLTRNAECDPNRRGFIFLQDGETDEHAITYKELHLKAARIAALLQQRVAPGERAILLYPAGIEFIAAFYACLYAGVIAVPAYPPVRGRVAATLPRLRAIADNCGARIIMTSETLDVPVEVIVAEAPELGALTWLTTDVPGPDVADFRPTKIDSKAVAFLQYTSGSTGTPKGVVLQHDQVLANVDMLIQSMGLRARSADVFWLPLYHDMGLVSSVLCGTKLCNENVLMPPLHFVQRPFRWLRAISRFRATWGGAPNFAYELCLQKITAEERDTLDLSCWECAFNGAEPIRAETVRRFAEVFASTGLRPEALFPCYGLAEATLIVSGSGAKRAPRICRFDAAELEQQRAVLAVDDVRSVELVSTGWPAQGTDVRIVDPETRRERESGEVGEIWVASPSVACGYFGVQSPSFGASIAGTDERSFLRTGDLGFMMDGELFVAARMKDVLIVRGRKLHPQDLELTCEKSHPSIRNSGTAAVQIRVGNEDGVALILTEPKASSSDVFDAQEVMAAVRLAIAEQHEIEPLAIAIISARALPKTSSGKLRRQAVRETYLRNEFDVVAQWLAVEGICE